MSKKSMNDKPHITSGIKVSIRHKDRLYKKSQENLNKVNKAIYKRYKNKLTETIKNAEKLYYKKIISSHKTAQPNFGKRLAKF